MAGTDLGIGLFELAGKQPQKRIAIKTMQTVGGPSWPNSCHVCEVEVDPETGVTEIVRYTTVDDVGRVVNPMIVAGQVHGGIAQAVGQALLEDARYDPRKRPARDGLVPRLLHAARRQPAEHSHVHRRDLAVQDQSARREGRGRARHGGWHADGR